MLYFIILSLYIDLIIIIYEIILNLARFIRQYYIVSLLNIIRILAEIVLSLFNTFLNRSLIVAILLDLKSDVEGYIFELSFSSITSTLNLVSSLFLLLFNNIL